MTLVSYRPAKRRSLLLAYMILKLS